MLKYDSLIENYQLKMSIQISICPQQLKKPWKVQKYCSYKTNCLTINKWFTDFKQFIFETGENNRICFQGLELN